MYWNNYYFWDEANPPNIIVYRNGINFNMLYDYDGLIKKAIESSLEYTSHFLNYLN